MNGDKEYEITLRFSFGDRVYERSASDLYWALIKAYRIADGFDEEPSSITVALLKD